MGRWSYSFREGNERLTREHANGGSTAAERECARGEWCASAIRARQDDGTTKRIPASGPRAFCHADEVIITTALRSFPATWCRLWPAMLDHVVGEVLVRIPFGPSVPVRCDADEVLRMLVDCALSWHERVAAVDPSLSPPGSGDDATQEWHRRALGRHAPLILAGSADRLAGRVTALLGLELEPMVRPELVAAIGCGEPAADPARTWNEAVATAAGLEPGSPEWSRLAGELGHAPQVPPGTVLVEAGGAEAGSEVLRLDYLARAVLGETNPDKDQLLGVACPGCGHRALRRAAPPQHDGDQVYFAACNDCRELVTETEFRDHTDYLVRFYKHRVTPAMLASAGLRGDESPAIMAAVA